MIFFLINLSSYNVGKKIYIPAWTIFLVLLEKNGAEMVKAQLIIYPEVDPVDEGVDPIKEEEVR